MVRRTLVAAVALVAIAFATVVPGASSAEVGDELGMQRIADRARPYWLYVPEGKPPKDGFPFVMYLHGCNQDGTNVAIGTRWLEVAKRERFVVAFPEQIVQPLQTIGCWNWFLPEHQQRGAGEPGILAQITNDVIDRHDVDKKRVFVSGASAGANMATILGATYPDLFAAIAPFAGCAYATCADVTGTLAHRAMGERARVVPSLIVQGTADPLNNMGMGESLVRQQLGTSDWADNGARDGSIPQQPKTIEHFGFTQEQLKPGAPGEVCARNQSFPCPGGALGWKSYPYTIERYFAPNGELVVESWHVHGLMHNYPGGVLQEKPYRTNFVDPVGPNITEAVWGFFTQHAMEKAKKPKKA